MKPRLPFPLVLGLLAILAIPACLEEARDVDVLLYMASAARANAAGALPYGAAWIEKGPAAMGLFQGIAAVFGRSSFAGVSLVWLACAAAGAWLARALAREAGATWADGWAALFTVVSLGAVGGTLNTEVPAMVLAAAACLAWLRGRPLVAGLLASGAFLCRQNAGVLAPALVLLAVLAVTAGDTTPRRGVRSGALVVAGFLLPAVAVAAVFALAGDWKAFLFCVYGYNAGVYLAATHVTAARLARIPWDVVVSFLWPMRTTAALGVAGAIAGWRGSRPARSLAIVVLALLAAMVPGLRFFSHYAAVAVPMLAALAAIGLEAVVARVPGRAALAIAVVAFVLGTELADRGWLDTGARLKAWIERGGYRAIADPLEWPGRDESIVPVARYVRENGSPDDRVFVWGMRPHVPVYADRLAATRFVTCTFLTGLVPWERVGSSEDTTPWIVPGAWELLARDLDHEKPAFIVDASQDHLFADGAYAIDKFPVLRDAIARDYERVFTSAGRDTFVVWKRRAAASP